MKAYKYTYIYMCMHKQLQSLWAPFRTNITAAAAILMGPLQNKHYTI